MHPTKPIDEIQIFIIRTLQHKRKSAKGLCIAAHINNIFNQNNPPHLKTLTEKGVTCT